MSSKICTLCKKYYNKNANKPFILECGDTLCQKCINNYRVIFQKDEFECPTCFNYTKSSELENKSAYPKEEDISNSNPNTQTSGDKFEIFIRDKYSSKFALMVTKTMTVGQVINEIQREKGYNLKDIRLSFKKPLDDYSKTLEYYGIIKTQTLSMIWPIKGGGGLGVDMADISNEKGLVKKNYGKAAKWNKITTGLNLTGKCENTNCEAYGKEVDCQIGLGTFDLVGDCYQGKCPMCEKEITLSTCTFCECQYKLKGKKKTKDVKKIINLIN